MDGYVGEALLLKTSKVSELSTRVRDGTLKHYGLRGVIEPVKQRIKESLESRIKIANTKTASNCQRILKQYRSLWTFVRVKEVEPAGNRAERALRRAVARWRKSFGTQSPARS